MEPFDFNVYLYHTISDTVITMILACFVYAVIELPISNLLNGGLKGYL